MKTIRRIKWENLTTIAMIVFAIQRVLTIINVTGVTQDTSIEIAMYSLSVIGLRYLIKELRLNPTNWLIDKK
jgi:thiamine transporter ThiT